MYDFNYFKPYHKVKGKTNWSRLIGFIVILTVLAFVAFDVFKMVMQLNLLRGEISGMEAQLKDPMLSAAIQEVDEAQEKLIGLRSDSFSVAAMQTIMARDGLFDYDKLKTVFDRLADDSYLESLTYSGRQLQLKGIAEKDALTNIAQFVYNLRASGEFDGFNINLVYRPLEGEEMLYGFDIGFIPVEHTDTRGR